MEPETTDAARLSPEEGARRRRYAAMLRQIANNLESERDDDVADESARARDSRQLANLARNIYSARRKRGRAFGHEGLFGEPAWDMLLDLYVAEAEGTRLPVTSACIGAAVPTTTALRWLNILESHQLIARKADPYDARRTYVRISSQGRRMVEEVLAQFAATIGVGHPAE